MEKISIIIPHFQSWSLLKQLLGSIPDIPLFEVIVIDDHSKDNCMYLSEMKEQFSNVSFYVNDTNKKGAGAARNKGLQLATGKWLLFSDSDDLFMPNFVDILQKYIKSDYDIIFFTPSSFMDGDDSVSLRHKTFERYINEYLVSKEYIKELTLRYNFSAPWSKLISRELVEKNNINFDEIKVANDVMFSAKIGKYANSITATEEIIYSVRQLSGSITSVVSKENFLIRFNTWVRMVNFMQENIEKDVFKKMNISIIPQIISSIQSKLGVTNILYILKTAYTHNIPMFDNRIFNLKFLLKSFSKQKRLHASNKRTTITK